MRPLRIIVAEDDPSMRRWIRLVLSRNRVSVREATNGPELLLILTSVQHIDLVISDLRMPLMDGLEVLAMVRAVGMDVPFLLITAFGEGSLRRSAEELHAQMLDKPFSARELLDCVSTLVSREVNSGESNGAC